MLIAPFMASCKRQASFCSHSALKHSRSPDERVDENAVKEAAECLHGAHESAEDCLELISTAHPVFSAQAVKMLAVCSTEMHLINRHMEG